jgi:hypothetical protein
VAFTSLGTVAEAQNKTSASSIAATFSDAVPVGTLLVLRYAGDNITTPNNSDDTGTTEISGVADSQSNTWTRARGVIRGAGTAAAGVVGHVWYCVVTTALSTSDTVTVTLASSRTAKALHVEAYSFGGGTIGVAITNGANGASTTPSVASGTADAAVAGRLWIGHTAYERPTSDTDPTRGSDWDAAPAEYGTTGGTAATNVLIAGGRHITTATSRTWASTHPTSSDWAAIVVAFDETTVPDTITVEVRQDTTLIATRSIEPGATWSGVDLTLSTGEVAAITDPTALRVVLSKVGTTGGLQVSEVALALTGIEDEAGPVTATAVRVVALGDARAVTVAREGIAATAQRVVTLASPRVATAALGAVRASAQRVVVLATPRVPTVALGGLAVPAARIAATATGRAAAAGLGTITASATRIRAASSGRAATVARGALAAPAARIVAGVRHATATVARGPLTAPAVRIVAVHEGREATAQLGPLRASGVRVRALAELPAASVASGGLGVPTSRVGASASTRPATVQRGALVASAVRMAGRVRLPGATAGLGGVVASAVRVPAAARGTAATVARGALVVGTQRATARGTLDEAMVAREALVVAAQRVEATGGTRVAAPAVALARALAVRVASSAVPRTASAVGGAVAVAASRLVAAGQPRTATTQRDGLLVPAARVSVTSTGRNATVRRGAIVAAAVRVPAAGAARAAVVAFGPQQAGATRVRAVAGVSGATVARGALVVSVQRVVASATPRPASPRRTLRLTARRTVALTRVDGASAQRGTRTALTTPVRARAAPRAVPSPTPRVATVVLVGRALSASPTLTLETAQPFVAVAGPLLTVAVASAAPVFRLFFLEPTMTTLYLRPLNDLAFTVDARVVDTSTGALTPLTDAVPTPPDAFLATTNAPTAEAADPSLVGTVSYLAPRRRWLVRFDAPLLTPTLLDDLWGPGDGGAIAYAIVRFPGDIRVAVPLEYQRAWEVAAV